MSGLAVIVRWDGRPVETGEIRRMLAPVPHRGPDGTGVWVDQTPGVGVGMGHALLATTVANREPQPLRSPESSCVVVADVALYNRPELIDRLGDVRWLRDDPSDAALLLAGYEQAGEGFLDWLEGDYAFVIWDARRRRVLAARDHFGARTLYYREQGVCLAFASEVKQLTQAGLASRAPDPQAVAEYLLFDFRSKERTFFRDVRAVPGGHCLSTRGEGARARRYWYPGSSPSHVSASTDLPDRFRELLQRAVERRLQVGYPVLMHLSNGFDSAAIVSLAARLHREGARLAPRMETGTWVHPGAVLSRVLCRQELTARAPFASHEFECRDQPLLPLAIECVKACDGPFAPIELPVLALQSEYLRGQGVRALLMGFGGDDVLWDGGLLADLAAHGRYRLLWGESPDLRTFLRMAAPRALKLAFRRRFPHVVTPRVGWVLPDLVAAVTADTSEVPPAGASHLQKALWAGPVAGSFFQRCVGEQQTLSALDGVELRFPFLDRRLVEFLWGFPAEARPSRGNSKRILREAMVGVWPRAYDSRNDRGDPLSPYPEDLLAGSWTDLRDTTLESLALSRYAVDAAAAREWLLRAGSRPLADSAGRRDFWRLASVALWSRLLEVK